jgi:hypothetical protein
MWSSSSSDSDMPSGKKDCEIDEDILKRKDAEEYMQPYDAVAVALNMAAMPKLLPASSSTGTPPPADITMQPIS